MRLSSFAAIVLFVVAVPAVADTGWEHWNIAAKHSKIESYLGRDSLLLDDGNAWLDDANFQDGVIEFDMAASGQPGFHGLAFRAADHDNYEEVYLRAHLSDKPDATQYTPVFNGLWGWQIYAGPRFTQQVTIVPDRWIHVQVVVHGDTGVLTGISTSAVDYQGSVSSSPRRFLNIFSKKDGRWLCVAHFETAISTTRP